MVQRVPQALVAEVSDVENDPEPLDLLQQLSSFWPEITIRVGAVRVPSGAVVGWPHSAEPLPICVLQVRGCENRVGAFEAQDVSDRGWRLASAFAAGRFGRDNFPLSCKRRLAGGWHICDTVASAFRRKPEC